MHLLVLELPAVGVIGNDLVQLVIALVLTVAQLRQQHQQERKQQEQGQSQKW